MLIPHVSTDKFLAARNTQELIELTRFDANAFDKNRLKLVHEYKNVLIQSGAIISDSLQSLASEVNVTSQLRSKETVATVNLSR